MRDVLSIIIYVQNMLKSSLFALATQFFETTFGALGNANSAYGAPSDMLVSRLHMRAAFGDVDKLGDVVPLGIVLAVYRARRTRLFANLAISATAVAKRPRQIELLVRQDARKPYLRAELTTEEQRVLADVPGAAQARARLVRKRPFERIGVGRLTCRNGDRVKTLRIEESRNAQRHTVERGVDCAIVVKIFVCRRALNTFENAVEQFEPDCDATAIAVVFGNIRNVRKADERRTVVEQHFAYPRVDFIRRLQAVDQFLSLFAVHLHIDMISQIARLPQARINRADIS